MRLKTLLSRSLLVAVGLLAGANAWGQVSTWTAASGTYTKGQEIKGSTEGIITMTLGEDDNWSYNTSRKAIYASTQQTPTLTNGIPTAGGYVVITPSRDINLSLTTYSSQSNCNLYMVEASAPSTYIKNFRQKAYCTNDFGTLEAGKTYYIYGGGFKNNKGDLEYIFYQKFTATTIETYTIKYVDGNGNTIAEDKTHTGLYGAEVTASEEDMAQITYNGSTYAYESGNETITLGSESNVITLKYETVAAAKYTIKYVDGNGNSIADDVTKESFVGAEVTASDDNIPTYITKDDVKYKYVSGNTTLTVSGTEANNVITLVYNEAAKYSYTVKASTGKTLQEGTEYENETITYYWPAVLNVDGTLYTASAVNSQYKASFTLDANNKDITVSYTASTTGVTNLVYLAEGEDAFTKGTGANADIRLSLGAGGYASEKTEMVTLPVGVYTIAGVNRGSTTGVSDHTFYAGDNEILITTPQGYNNSFSKSFTLTESTTIYMQGGGENKLIDYVYINKTGEIVTINSNKLASYSNTQTVTVPEDVTIYIATENDGSTVTLTKVDGSVIPANTGVILYSATAGAKTLTYGGTEPTVSGNILKNTASSAYTVTSTDNIYALVKTEQAVAKVNTGVEIPANKAYLDGGNAAKLNIVFDGTVTGIGSVQTSNATNGSNAIYNLSGQRVSGSYKGVVVKGGKKYIQK